MIGTITPLVKAAGRRIWFEAVVAHLVGGALSGSALGLLLGVCGLVVGLHRWPAVTGVVSSLVFLFCAVCDVEMWPWRLPTLKRQTPASCQCALGTTWAGFFWGADLAQGWTTFIVLTGYYGIVVWALLAARPVESALVLAAYGLGRAMPVLVAGILATRIGVTRLALVYGNHMTQIRGMNALLFSLVAGYVMSVSYVH
jgi:cytochrome c biogenesis protein CcdA